MHKTDIDPWFVERAGKMRGGRPHAYETLTPSRTALVVVDMQNYFCADGMPSCAPVARTIVPNINRLAECLRATGGHVVWIQTEALTDEADWANRREATNHESWNRRRALLAPDGEGFPIFPSCDVRTEDRIVRKFRYSAFIPYPSELDGFLRESEIDSLLVTGVATSTCCDSTARDASMWGYRTIMVSDGNADKTDLLHNHTLGKFMVTFGDVQSTDELIDKLQAKATASAAQ